MTETPRALSDVREEIVEVLADWNGLPPMAMLTRLQREGVADVLAPLVERIAKERTADEIRAIAHRLDDGGHEAIEVALGGAAYVHRVLCDCAHALDGKP